MTTDIDHREYRKRVWMRLLTSPLTLVPFLAGATLLIGAWAVGARAGAAIFAGVVALLAGVGSFFTRLFAGGVRFLGAAHLIT